MMWWHRRARKQQVLHEYEGYVTSRMANVEPGVFQDEVMKLEWESKLIDMEDR